jgi:hypothetical protein
LDAAPTLSGKLLEVAAVKDVGVNLRVKFPGVPERARFVKAATPPTAATVVVPFKVPDPEAIDATTLTLEVVTVFPEASVTLITGWVVRASPLTAPDGSVVIMALDAIWVINPTGITCACATNPKTRKDSVIIFFILNIVICQTQLFAR